MTQCALYFVFSVRYHHSAENGKNLKEKEYYQASLIRFICFTLIAHMQQSELLADVNIYYPTALTYSWRKAKYTSFQHTAKSLLLLSRSEMNYSCNYYETRRVKLTLTNDQKSQVEDVSTHKVFFIQS